LAGKFHTVQLMVHGINPLHRPQVNVGHLKDKVICAGLRRYAGKCSAGRQGHTWLANPPGADQVKGGVNEPPEVVVKVVGGYVTPLVPFGRGLRGKL